jgi:hypothetical protein
MVLVYNTNKQLTGTNTQISPVEMLANNLRALTPANIVTLLQNNALFNNAMPQVNPATQTTSNIMQLMYLQVD